MTKVYSKDCAVPDCGNTTFRCPPVDRHVLCEECRPRWAHAHRLDLEKRLAALERKHG